MPSKGGLYTTSPSCLLYVRYLGKLKTLKITRANSKGASFSEYTKLLKSITFVSHTHSQ